MRFGRKVFLGGDPLIQVIINARDLKHILGVTYEPALANIQKIFLNEEKWILSRQSSERLQ